MRHIIAYFCLICAGFFFTTPSLARLSVGGGLQLSESYYYQNHPDSDERAFTDLTPSIAATLTGRHVSGALNYNYKRRVAHIGGSSDNASQYLSANGSAELLKRRLVLAVIGSIGQRIEDPLNNFSVDRNLDENRSEVWSGNGNIKLNQPVFSFAQADVGYNYGRVINRDSLVADSITQRYTAAVENRNQGQKLQWNMSYDKSTTTYSMTDKNSSERYQGQISYALSRKVRLGYSAGQEIHEENINDNVNARLAGNQPEGEFWNVFLSWAPTSRTDSYFSVGERFFGTTYNASVSHQMRRISIGLSYTEDVATRNIAELQSESYVLYDESGQILYEGVNPLFTYRETLFIQKRATVNIVYARDADTGGNLMVSNETRGHEDEVDEEVLRAELALNKGFGRRMNSRISYSKQFISYRDLDRKDTVDYATLLLQLDIGRLTTLSGQVNVLNRDSDQSDQASESYIALLSFSTKF